MQCRVGQGPAWRVEEEEEEEEEEGQARSGTG
jgi:hypothetical protein